MATSNDAGSVGADLLVAPSSPKQTPRGNSLVSSYAPLRSELIVSGSFLHLFVFYLFFGRSEHLIYTSTERRGASVQFSEE
jgi:hypothetical protein